MGSNGLPPSANELPVSAGSDAALVLRAQQDRDAFGLLYDRYFDAMFRFCFYRLGDWQEAEDAASDIFMKALASLSNFTPADDTQSFRCWLFAIARHVVTDLHRYHGRHPVQPLDAALFMPDTAPTLEEHVMTTDDHQLVRNLLAQLKPEQRSLLELRLAGLKNAEIASLLGRSHESIRKEQSRIVQSLRVLVNHQAEQGASDA